MANTSIYPRWQLPNSLPGGVPCIGQQRPESLDIPAVLLFWFDGHNWDWATRIPFTDPVSMRPTPYQLHIQWSISTTNSLLNLGCTRPSVHAEIRIICIFHRLFPSGHQAWSNLNVVLGVRTYSARTPNHLYLALTMNFQPSRSDSIKNWAVLPRQHLQSTAFSPRNELPTILDLN